LAAARGEGRKAGAVCGGTSLRLICRRAGERAQAWKPEPRTGRNRRRKQAATEGQRHARGPLQNEGAKARANTPERGRPEGWPEGKAGDERRKPGVERRSRKAAGGLSESKGRKPGAETQPESEARGSGRKSELRATPKGQGKGEGRKAQLKDASPNQGATAARESTGDGKLQVQA